MNSRQDPQPANRESQPENQPGEPNYGEGPAFRVLRDVARDNQENRNYQHDIARIIGEFHIGRNDNGHFVFRANGVAGLIGMTGLAGSGLVATYSLYKFLTKAENPSQLVTDIAKVIANSSGRALTSIADGSLVFSVFVSGEENINDMCMEFNNGTMIGALQHTLSSHCKERERVKLDTLDIIRGAVLKATPEQVAEIKRESEDAMKQPLDFSQHEIVLSKHPALSHPVKEILISNVDQRGSVDIISAFKAEFEASTPSGNINQPSTSTAATNTEAQSDVKGEKLEGDEVSITLQELTGGLPKRPEAPTLETSKKESLVRDAKQLVASHKQFLIAQQEHLTIAAAIKLYNLIDLHVTRDPREILRFAKSLRESEKPYKALTFFQVAASCYKTTANGKEAAVGIMKCCFGMYQASKDLNETNSDAKRALPTAVKIMENLREMIVQLENIDPPTLVVKEAWCLNSIAGAWTLLGDLQAAIDTYERGIAALENTLDSPNKFRVYGYLMHNQADALSESARMYEAAEGYRKAIEAYKQARDFVDDEKTNRIDSAERGREDAALLVALHESKKGCHVM